MSSYSRKHGAVGVQVVAWYSILFHKAIDIHIALQSYTQIKIKSTSGNTSHFSNYLCFLLQLISHLITYDPLS